MSDYQFDTKCIQSGYHPGNAEPRTLPIYQSTTYKYDDADALGQLFDLKAEGHMYSRISNPTLAAVEEKLSELHTTETIADTSMSGTSEALEEDITKMLDNLDMFN